MVVDTIGTELLHDLRMPLQLIYSCAQMLEMEYEQREPGLHQYVAMMLENVSHMRRMLTHFLDEERIGENSVRANLTVGDLCACVRDICLRCKKYAAEYGITLTYGANVVGLAMGFDVEMFTRIMLNLLSNAFKHTTAGGIVRIEMEALGDFVEVHVRDTGSGIPQERLRAIFERGITTGGYGLGLHISRAFAKLHGGDIRAHSVVGEGSVFTVRLPIREVDACAAANVSARVIEENVKMEMGALGTMAGAAERNAAI